MERRKLKIVDAEAVQPEVEVGAAPVTEPAAEALLTDAPVFSADEATGEEKKAERERLLDEAAKLDDADFEEQRLEITKRLGKPWRSGTLEKERERRRRAHAKSAPKPTPPPPDIDALAAAAKDIIAEPDVLAAFRKSIARSLAGEATSAELIYLCATSRLFPKPMNVAVKGLSAIGKSHLRDRVLEYIPPEDVVAFTTMTERALLYLPKSLSHKILSMAEAMGGGRDHELQDYLLREIISEGSLTHMITVPGAPGEVPRAQKVVVEGPIMFITTTTRARLHPEIETRILSVETDDTASQTRRVLVKVAEMDGDLADTRPDLRDWHAFQRWLAAGERRVVIPFARPLAVHKGLYDKGVRMRRDFRQVLSAVKAHALLNREHRLRDEQGRIVATVEDDYAAVFDIMADRLAQGAGVKLKANDLRVLDAIREETGNDGVRVTQLVDILSLDQTTINRRLIKLATLGYVENVTPGKGRTGHYRALGEPRERAVLPDPDDLLAAIKKGGQHS